MQDIFNFLQISDRVATAGQPTEAQLESIKNAGYQTVINLAPPTSKQALPNEPAIVESLGMRYVSIPVDFNQPTIEDFDRFSEAMQEAAGDRIFVHCIANYRVSAFLYLYRRLYENLSDEQATRDLLQAWTPNPTWQAFIQQTLAQKSSLL